METSNDLKTELRKLAEEKWRQRAQLVEKLNPQDPERFIHELEVHQIELEMQNEELQLTRQELEESREKYFDLYDLAPVGYLTLTETGIICQANLTAARLLGLERQQLVNKLFFRFVLSADQDAYILNHNKLITSGEREQFDLRLKRNDNSTFWAHIISVLSWKQDGSFENRLIISDISELKNSEASLYETNAKLIQLNAEKDKFFSIIAHDLKSPFTGLLGISELLADESNEFTTEEIKDFSATLNHSVQNLYKLLLNLLEWAQLQKGTLSFNPQKLDLSKLIFENIDEIKQRAEQKGILIQSEIPEDQGIYADQKMINSIIRNLLNNAVKFTSSGGKVIIRSRAVDHDRIEVSVQDTGTGISKENIGRLFRIDEKVSSPGTDGEPSTGLGLLLVKEFVEKHGGSIRVESDPDGHHKGKGSSFIICLPVKLQ